MKKVLTFIGKHPEDTDNFKHIEHAGDYYMSLWDFSQWIRAKIKHEGVENVPIEEVREKFYEILSDNDVTIGWWIYWLRHIKYLGY